MGRNFWQTLYEGRTGAFFVSQFPRPLLKISFQPPVISSRNQKMRNCRGAPACAPSIQGGHMGPPLQVNCRLFANWYQSLGKTAARGCSRVKSGSGPFLSGWIFVGSRLSREVWQIYPLPAAWLSSITPGLPPTRNPFGYADHTFNYFGV